jgi:hypothetical protein
MLFRSGIRCGAVLLVLLSLCHDRAEAPVAG